MRPSVMIIEDSPALARGLADNFRHAGYDVRLADNGATGLEQALANPPDLAVLDVMLPSLNGYEVCRRLRSAGQTFPILMLTVKDAETDIVLGLNLGADDYVTKPFGIQELLARAGALLRRARPDDETSYRFGEFELNLAARQLLHGGNPVSLTPTEFRTLELLVRRRGRALTRDQILDAAWNGDLLVGTRSVDRCVTTLRQKIEVDPRRPRYIQTVREVGYRFQGD